ncbi:MAG: TlpA family protein disulfide reductase [Myxococcota bacterium]|nr:TlpA family protein disulfide reductase [Myxococcota bacterium]
MKLSRLLLVLALGALVGTASMVAPSGLGAPPSIAHARVGGRPPPFSLPAATGGPSRGEFRMGDLIGQSPVVILFWATWCVPCQQELPFYQSLYERYRDQGLRIVAISMDDARSVQRAGPAARRLGVTFDVVTDLDTRITTQLNPRRSAPFSIWVDRQGRITWEREGFAPSEQQAIAAGIQQLVAR